MNRLETELDRLYGGPGRADASPARALVLELGGPDPWTGLSRVWRGVQADLELPAPAVAVSGTDGLQLWFSLQAPAPVPQAQAWLALLQARYLHDVPAGRVRLHPSASGPACTAPRAPTQVPGTEHWSAVVAPDLAPIFSETPWLDIEPSPEGQADLLARLQSITPAGLEAAWQRLAGASPAPAAAAAPLPDAPAPVQNLDPRQFLQQVLDNEALDLALRIEAAKALLQAR